MGVHTGVSLVYYRSLSLWTYLAQGWGSREITEKKRLSVDDGRTLQVAGSYAKRSRMPIVHKDDVGSVFRPG